LHRERSLNTSKDWKRHTYEIIFFLKSPSFIKIVEGSHKQNITTDFIKQSKAEKLKKFKSIVYMVNELECVIKMSNLGYSLGKNSEYIIA